MTAKTTARSQAAADATAAFRAGKFSSIKDAAEAHGCTYSAVWKRLHPDAARTYGLRADPIRENERKRKWEREHRATCPRCGGEMAQGSASSEGGGTAKRGKVCTTCRSDVRVERVVAMMRLRSEDDLSTREIAKRLDAPRATIASEFCRLRVLGFEIPHDPYNRSPKRRVAVAPDAPTFTLADDLRKHGIDVPRWPDRNGDSRA